MNPPALQKTSGLAVTSLILGLLSLCCPLFLPAIAAVACGHIARGKINKSEGTLAGSGLALAGLLLGYIGIIFSILSIVAYTMIGGSILKLSVNVEAAQKIHTAVVQMVSDGTSKEDKSLGWPADAGITTAEELEKRLVDNGYLTADEAKSIGFDNFLFGNVSESDPGETIFIKVRTKFWLGTTVFLQKDGEPGALAPDEETSPQDPQRDPAYLAP
jgi:hypothetical protein